MTHQEIWDRYEERRRDAKEISPGSNGLSWRMEKAGKGNKAADSIHTYINTYSRQKICNSYHQTDSSKVKACDFKNFCMSCA